MKYYIIAGEASGDIHAANLVTQVKKLDPQAEFRGFGGERMEAEGVQLTRSLDQLAYMGFAAVVLNLRKILNNIAVCKEDILEFETDKLILVDYPGFNLRIAKWAKEKGVEIDYYISPQVWAWKEGRVKTIKKVVDRMMVILPFEKDFYADRSLEVDFVGHPLIDEIDRWKAEQVEVSQQGNGRKQPVVILMPGSRKQEISKMLPVMLEVAKRAQKTRFIVGRSSHIPIEFYQRFKLNGVEVSSEGSYTLLSKADAALVTSGTATLETALFKVPQIVCYRGDAVFINIARWIIKVPYISLVNLILNRRAVPELIQGAMNPDDLEQMLIELLKDTPARKQQLADYEELEMALGSGGASARAAKLIVQGS